MRAGRVGEDAELLERLGSSLRAELSRLLPEAGQPPSGAASDVRPVFESVAQVIGMLGGRHPLLIILEDVHWADEMSARLVAFVGRRLAGRHVLLVATARDEELADLPAVRQALDDLRRDALIDTLTLGPLSHTDTVALVRAITRRPGGPSNPSLIRFSSARPRTRSNDAEASGASSTGPSSTWNSPVSRRDRSSSSRVKRERRSA